MHTAKTHRKWTARLELDTVEVEAEQLKWDTMRETGEAAIKEAAEYIRAGLAKDARVTLYKQLTNDPAPVEDRCYAYVYLENGRVWVAR